MFDDAVKLAKHVEYRCVGGAVGVFEQLVCMRAPYNSLRPSAACSLLHAVVAPTACVVAPPCRNADTVEFTVDKHRMCLHSIVTLTHSQKKGNCLKRMR